VPEFARLLALGVLAAPVAIAAIGSLWALRALGRSPRNARPERRAAARVAAALAAIALLGVTGYFVLLGQAFGAPMATGLTYGLGLGALLATAIFSSAVLGYAVLASPRRGTAALAGTILGPLVLGGATALGAQVFGTVDAAIYRDQYCPDARAADMAEVDRLESIITVTIVDVESTTIEAPHPVTGVRRTLVESLRLTLRVQLDAPMDLGSATGPANAWFYPDAAIASGFDVTLPLDAPYSLPAGDTTIVVSGSWPDRVALVGWPDAPEPGSWTLHLQFRPATVTSDVRVDEVVPFEVTVE
jgi:hypothetical protein